MQCTSAPLFRWCTRCSRACVRDQSHGRFPSACCWPWHRHTLGHHWHTAWSAWFVFGVPVKHANTSWRILVRLHRPITASVHVHREQSYMWVRFRAVFCVRRMWRVRRPSGVKRLCRNLLWFCGIRSVWRMLWWALGSTADAARATMPTSPTLQCCHR